MKAAPLAIAAAMTVSLAAAGAAYAQKKVYRCEAGGKVTYGDAPCKDAAEVKADDARTEVQRKAAQDVVLREDKMADKLARERLAAEKAAARQGPAHVPYSAADRAASAPGADKKKAKS